MDLSLLETINGYAARHDSLFEDPLRFVAVEAPVLFIVLLAALFLANGKLASRSARHGVVAAGFSAALAIAVAIFLRSRRLGWVALAMAALVSVGRVVVGTHYPSDVLAGAAIGTLSALVFFHPRVRGPLHALADSVGAIYDGLLLRRPQTG
jgi:hypothetical protein